MNPQIPSDHQAASPFSLDDYVSLVMYSLLYILAYLFAFLQVLSRIRAASMERATNFRLF